jgi:hypothetical protein
MSNPPAEGAPITRRLALQLTARRAARYLGMTPECRIEVQIAA